MKRIFVLALLFLAGAGFLMVAYADADHGKRWGRGHEMGRGMGPGHGRGHGMGPGMMGMGPGMMPFYNDLSPEKQKQMEQLHLSISKDMMSKNFAVSREMGKLRDTLHAFPLDQEAARTQWQTVNRIRGELFQLRLAMMTSMQQIVGEEIWGRMQKFKGRHGAGRGGPNR